jgi:tetratricopeptide (TPR) repeat protein
MRHRFSRLICFVLASLCTSNAPAQTRKEPPHGSELAKKRTSKVPERDLAGDISRPKKDKLKDRPALEYDQYRLGVELQVASKRHEQIETLQKIIRIGAGSEKEMPDLVFRLAELYWEESKYYFFEANRMDDSIIKAKANNDPAALQAAEAEKREDQRKLESFQLAAIDQYRTIIKKYPQFERMDEVLFFLGSNMWEAGKEREASLAYQKLIKDHPKSKFVPDAWVALGQYFFNNSKGRTDFLEKALASFKKAATFTESKVYGFAIYMQGWTFFNLGDFESARDRFKAVIFLGELQKDRSALAKEARKDFVSTYARIGDVLQAKSEFQKVGGEEHWWGMLKGLANIYFGDGKDKESTLVYSQLIKERPLSPEAPFFQARIVDCMVRVGNKKIIVSQTRELVRIIKEVEKTGKITSAEDRKSYAEARDLAEKIMSHLAVNWHNEAKKTRDEQTFLLASEVYQDYLEVFSGSPKAYDLRFFYAELLNDNLNQYERAAREYSQVVLEDIKKMEPTAGADGKPAKDGEGNPLKPEKPGRWLVNAAYNAILAYDEVAKKFEKDEVLPKSDPKHPAPIPAPKKNLLAACERYIKYVPKGDKFVEVTYKTANIYYRYSYLEKAVPLFALIALEHPDSELAEYAANLVLDSYNILSDWAKMNEWARKFWSQPKLAKGKFKEDLAKVLEQSSFKLINILEEQQAFAAAGDAYLTFVREFPASDLADLALYNASVDFFKGKQVDRSIDVRKLLVERYPRSRYMPQCIYANGESFETIGDFEPAAAAYEEYVSGFAEARGKRAAKAPAAKAKGKSAKDEQGFGGGFEESKAQVALFNAGVFREGLGQYREALRDRTRYLELWPNAKDAEAVFLSIGDLYEKSGAAAKALNHLDDYEKRYGRDPDKMLSAELRLAELFEKMGKPKDVNRIYGRVLGYYQKMNRAQKERLGPAALEALAKASYLAIEPEFNEYLRIGLPKEEKKLQAALESKKKALDEVQKRYTEVVGLKAAKPAICSLYRIGLLYQNFADVLVNAPVPEMPFPKELNPIRHLWNVPWKKWPKEYQKAVAEADFENLKKQLDEAKQQFVDAYKAQLAEWARPVEDKAAEAFSTTVERARELSIYNDCADRSLDLLIQKYKPVQYPKVTEPVLELKPSGEAREGNGLLAAVQPIPAPPKASAEASLRPPSPPPSQPPPARVSEPPALPPPEEDTDSALAGPSESEPTPLPARQERPPKQDLTPPKDLSEPDDPDLL